MLDKTQVEETIVEPTEKTQTHTTEILRKVLLATIGAAVIAQEEIEDLVNRMIEKGEIAEKDGRKMVKEFVEKRKTKTAKVEDEITKNIEGALQRMNIPCKADIEILNQKLTALSKKVDDLKEKEGKKEKVIA